MYIILWEYEVKPEKRTEFEKVYGSNGAWAKLFKNGSGFLGTELLRSDELQGTFVTCDKWETRESFENFLLQWKLEYNKLDGECEGLTGKERRIGGFHRIPSEAT